MRNAIERINLGDIWDKYNLHTEAVPDDLFEQCRDEIAERIKASSFYKRNNDCQIIIMRLENTEHVDDFDDIWNEFYDLCDLARIHISLISLTPTTK